MLGSLMADTGFSVERLWFPLRVGISPEEPALSLSKGTAESQSCPS